MIACGRSDFPASNPPPAEGDQRLTVVVVVVDSLMPEEINAATTPNLQALKDAGTFYPESRAMFSAETIPNHVAMMTGVVPSRNGIPTNNFIDHDADGGPAEVDLSLPEELTAHTTFAWLKNACVDSGVNSELRTGAVLSKRYLHEIFAGDDANPERANRNPAVNNPAPDAFWDPTGGTTYIPDPGGLALDSETMQESLARLPDVDFLFINLGQVDRAAHAFVQAGRAQALPEADTHIGLLVQQLQDAGRWESSVVIIVSDHGMDYADDNLLSPISTQPTLDALGSCLPSMTAVQNGGTNSIYVDDRTLSAAQRDAALLAARSCLTGSATDCTAACAGASPPANQGGLLHAWYTRPNSQDPGNNLPASLRSGHANLGDLVLVADDGFRFSEPSATSNPILGNHGHLATIRNTLLVSGGAPWIRQGNIVAPSTADPGPLDRLPEQSENIDVAPTVLWLFGLQPAAADFPDGQGFDGRVLSEAFTVSAPPSQCGVIP